MNRVFSPMFQLLSLGFLSLLTGNAWGQLPNQSRISPLNYLGRFHGIGYSDGYHACPKGNCSKRSFWSVENFSSFYGMPSAPTPSGYLNQQPSYSSYQASQFAYPHSAVPGTTAPASMPQPLPSPLPTPSPSTEKPNWEQIPTPQPNPQTIRQPLGEPFFLQSRAPANPYRQ